MGLRQMKRSRCGCVQCDAPGERRLRGARERRNRSVNAVASSEKECAQSNSIDSKQWDV